VPIVDHHDRVFSKQGRHVVLIGDLVNFHDSGEGPRGHEILHHVAVCELVLDGVGVVRASLLKELLEVIRGRPCLTLVTACGGRNMHHAGAALLLVATAVIIDRVYGLLTALLVPLLVALGTLSGILDDNVGRCFPAAT
jgi:hypothetical protein